MTVTRKARSDIALTLNIVRAIIERLETGEPLLKRGHPFILLDDQKLTNKVPVGTYNSWIARNTIPADSVDNLGFNELLIVERVRIEKEKRARFLKLGEKGLKKILSMPLRQKTIQKRINKNGEEYARVIRENVSGAVLNAKLKVIMFTLERSSNAGYGRYSNARKK